MAANKVNLKNIKALVLDTDGILTDGGLFYLETGEPLIRFDIQDGLAIVVARSAGLEVAIISGRRSEALILRAEHLGITEVIQGAVNKERALRELAARRGWQLSEIAYMGDDLNDLPALEIAGVRITVANGIPEAKEMAHLITTKCGGSGAVKEAIQIILEAQDRWKDAVQNYLSSLRSA